MIPVAVLHKLKCWPSGAQTNPITSAAAAFGRNQRSEASGTCK